MNSTEVNSPLTSPVDIASRRIQFDVPETGANEILRRCRSADPNLVYGQFRGRRIGSGDSQCLPGWSAVELTSVEFNLLEVLLRERAEW